jgi:hypothetical protein
VVLLAVKFYNVVLLDKTLPSVTGTHQRLGERTASTGFDDVRFCEGHCSSTTDGYPPASVFDTITVNVGVMVNSVAVRQDF